MAQQYFYDKQIRRYIQQFIRLFSGFSVQMGLNDDKLPIYQKVPVRYGDINRMAAHITRENSENIINSVPFIACSVSGLEMAPDRRTYQDHVDKVHVFEKKLDQTTGQYVNESGNKYTIERHAPVPYKMVMNTDIWTSNTDQKLQLLEQILVLFNPTLNIRTSDNPFDWSALSYVEMTTMNWSSRTVGSTIDDIIDVSTLTFELPVLINPPAKIKQQKLIYNLINELYSLDDENLDFFRNNEAFDTTSLQYTLVTFEDRQLRYENGKAYLLNKTGQPTDSSGAPLAWETDLRPFGELREGISQIRLRKGDEPGDTSNDIIGKLELDPTDPNALLVTIDTATLPSNTLNAIDAILNPITNYPGDGVVPAPVIGQRYLLTDDLPQANYGGLTAVKNDIIEYNGTAWVVSFDSAGTSTRQYVNNVASSDQLTWDGTDWSNSHEGVYKPAFWRLYL